MKSKVVAWSVHAYTALGLVAAAGIAVLLVQGGEGAFQWAFVLMFAAVLIDATDGVLARWARVKQVLPGFDGRRLDDLIDFLTYTFLPLLLIWRAELVPVGFAWCLLAPLLASAYGFSQVSAKTDDGFFLGFPSYWNLVAFYLYALRPPAWFAIGLILLLALLTFVPSRYLYSTQRGKLSMLTNVLAAIWAVMLLGVLWYLPSSPAATADTAFVLALISLFFPAYYFGVSWGISLRLWLAHRHVE